MRWNWVVYTGVSPAKNDSSIKGIYFWLNCIAGCPPLIVLWLSSNSQFCPFFS